MKAYIPCANAIETDLERIEQIVESIEPDVAVRISAIMAKANIANPSRIIISATAMMLKKYGIEYKEGNKSGRQDALEEDRL